MDQRSTVPILRTQTYSGQYVVRGHRLVLSAISNLKRLLPLASLRPSVCTLRGTKRKQSAESDLYNRL